MNSNEIRELIAALDEASTQARMLRVVADDIALVLYEAQAALASLQHEIDGRGNSYENMV